VTGQARDQRQPACDRCGSSKIPRGGLPDAKGDPHGFATVVTGDPQAILCNRCWWAANRERKAP
jgi:hypothetical protein